MKSKISIKLSSDVVDAVDRLTPPGGSRSETIERLLRESIAIHKHGARNQRDLELINRHAEVLNSEAEDVLSYQVDLQPR